MASGAVEAPPPPARTTVAPGRRLRRLPAVVASATGIVLPVTGQQGSRWVVGGHAVRRRRLWSAARRSDGVTWCSTPATGAASLGRWARMGSGEDLNLAVVAQARSALGSAGVGVVPTRSGDYRMTLVGPGQDRRRAVKPRGLRLGPLQRRARRAAAGAGHRDLLPDGWIVDQRIQATGRPRLRRGGQGASADIRERSWVADTDAGAKYRTSRARETTTTGSCARPRARRRRWPSWGSSRTRPRRRLYATAEVQAIAGQAVAAGVLRFLRTKDPGSGFVEPYPRQQPAGGGGGADNCVDPPLG